MNIFEKYYWIVNHPKLTTWPDDAIIEITPHMVCPETDHVENIKSVNTKLQFWVEVASPFFDEYTKQYMHSHDWELDCGGDTWEEAVEALYQKVLAKHGNYTEEDIEKIRDEVMKKNNISHDWLEQFVANAKDEQEPKKTKRENIHFFTEDEISEHIVDKKRLETYREVLHAELKKSGITMNQVDEINIELECVHHDITVIDESVKAGYDIEEYGEIDE